MLPHTWPTLAGSPFANTFLALATAFILGAAIGLERQLRQRNAGLRTNTLVAVGAAAFADLGLRLMGADGATRIISYVVSGIGFLGAGVILKDGTNIRGLNTAATLWCSAAVGTFAGSGFPAEAAAVTVFVLAGNTLLRPLVNWINRRPITPSTTEAEYRVHATCRPEHVSEVRDLLDAALDAANYPVREVETLSETEGQVELAAILVPNTAEDAELDAVVASLEKAPEILSATWSVETTA
jgi:putative Mg2+ transporter-C (MgtC) family protein